MLQSLNVCDVLKYVAFPVNYHDFYKLLREWGGSMGFFVFMLCGKEYYMLDCVKKAFTRVLKEK